MNFTRGRMLRFYEAAKRRFGLRGWWPTTPPGTFVPEYDPSSTRRLSEKDRFEIAVGAILTQNTAWSNVKQAVERLNRAGELTFFGIHRMRREKLAILIRPAGYYNQKSIKLHDFCQFTALEWQGRLILAKPEKTPVLREKLLSVRGIGPETADSILLYALEKPIFVIDAYTRRIFKRHGFIRGDEPYDEIRTAIERGLPKSVKLYNDFHAQLVELGKRYCKKNIPLCSQCPVYKKSLFAKGRPKNFKFGNISAI